MHVRKQASMAVAAVVAAAGIAAQAAPTVAVRAASGGNLTVVTTAAVTNFDPSLSSSTEVEYLANVYEGLTYAEPPGHTPAIGPALATSWSHSTDGKLWTFSLRHGVHFHDGSLMTAQSVAASLNRTIKANQGGAYIWASVNKIVPAGAYTVKFYLKYPDHLDYVASAEYGAWIMGPQALHGSSTWFSGGRDDGTGSYTISAYKSDREVVLKAFPGYWGGWTGQHYATIVSNIVAESAVQQEMIQGGQADIAKAIPVDSLASIKQNPQLTVAVGSSHLYYNAYFNTKRKPLNNVLVRRALSYAMSYQGIIKIGTAGYGKQLQGPMPYGLYPHDDSLPMYHYDLAKAQALLAQAGYPKGGFSLTLTYAAENPAEARWTPLIKESFAKLGIGLTLKPILFSSQWALAKGDPLKAQDIFVLLNWPTYNDSHPDLQAIYECQAATVWNLAYYCNHQYDNIVNKAVAEAVTQPQQAKSLFDRAQSMLYQDAPVAFLYQDVNILVLNRSVHGLTNNPSYPFVTFYYPLSPA
jgi:peptide/nickel transport system substrate-binding protein